MYFEDDIIETVIRHRNARNTEKATKGFRHITELGMDDLTYKARCHFAANGNVKFFDDEVMSLGANILQSPIERVAFAFLKVESFGLDLTTEEIVTVLPGDPLPKEINEKKGVVICPQHQVDGYFLDFGVFVNSGRVKLAFDVECDGIEFHGSSNAQTHHDWQRDIVISKKGFQIYRVSGQKINQNPLWAVEKFGVEVSEQILKLHSML